MEAVPRLPMTNFELKIPTEKVSFGQKIKQYIANFYHEDAETYNEEIHQLEALRGMATRPLTDVTGCQSLKKYYCQLSFLKSRFPMEEGQTCAVSFSWKDNHSNSTCSFADINFELACILYNIGALHSQLGAMDSRSSPEGMKMACTHFQCAAWAFQTIRENYGQFVLLFLPSELVLYMQHVCLAQAQECILEKSMLDNRKATIIAKVAVQVVDYYKQALSVLQSGGEDGSFCDLLGSKTCKRWIQYISFKIAYHKCVALLYQGQQAEEQQKMGERVAFYQAALDQLEEARKLASHMQNKQQLEEALVFTWDVVEGKRKAAKNENEFIYHEEVPEKDALQEVKGASLVKGIPFNINDVEVSGPDIFARLVPMEAHEKSSMYSEQKAQMLRRYGDLVDAKDQALAEFMSSLQLEFLSQIRQANGLTQDLIDRAAALSARPTATQDLVNAMGKLSNTYHEVEAMLNEIQALLQEEEKQEQEYQALMGKRPPSIIATDLARETAKYQEAHSKASESNQNLHKAMLTHIANLKILALPLSQLQVQIPSVELPNNNVDDNGLREIMNLVGKVEEMKTQRTMLWNQLREAVHNDDITGVLVTKQPEQSLEQVFQKELEKHQKLTSLLEQNTTAQDNICKALVDSYARFTTSRKYLQDLINKRSSTISALITSYDTYEDLLSKANKGLEFYSKLETNVTKLLGRIKSACKVQQEEREQILLKNGQVKAEPTSTTSATTPTVTTTTSRAPKLKDYLDSMKGAEKIGHPDISQYTNPSYPVVGQVGVDSTAWPPSVRPTPLGSEVTTDPPVPKIENRYGISQGQYPPNYMAQQYPQSGYPYPATDTDKNVDQALAERMASLMSGGKSKDVSAASHEPNIQQQYMQYSYGTTPYTYPSSTTAYTSTTQSYPTDGANFQTVSSTQYPYVTTSEHYASNYGATQLPATYDAAAYSQNVGATTNVYGYGAPQVLYQQGYVSSTTQDPSSNVPQQSVQVPPSTQAGQTSVQYPTSATPVGQLSQSYPAQAYSSPGQQYQYQSQQYPSSQQQSTQSQQQPTEPALYTTPNQQQYATTQAQQYPTQSQQYPASTPQYPSQYATQQYIPPQYPQSQYQTQNPQYLPQSQQYPAQSSQQYPSQTDPYASVYPPSSQYQHTSQTPQTTLYSQQSNIPTTSTYTSQYSTNYPQYYGQSQPSSTASATAFGGQYSSQQTTQAPSQSTGTTNYTTGYESESSDTSNQVYLGTAGNYSVDGQQASAVAGYGGYGTTPIQFTLAGSSTAYTINKDSKSSEYASYYSYGGIQNPTYPTAGKSLGNYGAAIQAASTAGYITPGQGTYTTPGQTPTTVGYNTFGQQATNVIYSSQYTTDPYNQQTGYQYETQSQSQPSNTYNPSQYNYYANYQTEVPTTQPEQTQTPYMATNISASVSNTNLETPGAKKETNIDLLAGLDFSISQAPLIPQQNPSTHSTTKDKASKTEQTSKQSPVKSVKSEEKSDIYETPSKEKIKTERLPRRDPLESPSSVRQFVAEIEKLEKFVDVLSNKSLNGPTPLDVKWKEVQESEIQKKSISVARCYPLKNRFPDILPYDYTRVALKTTKDDYINASYVKDITQHSPPFIVTQAPLQQTFDDFWTMIWEQQIEVVVCLLSDSELGVGIYWPQEKERNLILTNKVVSLQEVTIKDHWTERKFTITMPEQRDSRSVRHLQFTAWPGSLFPNPEPVIAFTKEVIGHFQQQNDDWPVLVHCSSGIGRSGLLTLLCILITETMVNVSTLPDLPQLAMKLSCARKNILRDREHLKFAYNAFLCYCKELYSTVVKSPSKEAPDVKKEVPQEKAAEVNDPLSSLDPLWATKRPS